MKWLRIVKGWINKNNSQPNINTIDIIKGMNKNELYQYGRKIGLKIDRRRKQSTLVDQILIYLDNNEAS
tara:strand:+ start:3392 stop:3598 length:207 start_codon:yes stop_codon:yes gene_type:complete